MLLWKKDEETTCWVKNLSGRPLKKMFYVCLPLADILFFYISTYIECMKMLFLNTYLSLQCKTHLSFRLSMLKNIKNNLSLHLAWYNLSIYLILNVCVCYCFVLNLSAISNILGCWNKDGWFDDINIFKLYFAWTAWKINLTHPVCTQSVKPALCVFFSFFC